MNDGKVTAHFVVQIKTQPGNVYYKDGLTNALYRYLELIGADHKCTVDVVEVNLDEQDAQRWFPTD